MIKRGQRETKSKMLLRFRPWHELPGELLEFILTHLFYFDHLRFRAVCKGWRSISAVATLKQIPMYMIWNKNPSIPSKIFDPTYKKSFSIHPNAEILIKDETLNLCASKFGWLLFCKIYKTKYGRYVAATSVFFFVNPFTGETIDHLPALTYSSFPVATFTSPPTSNNCLVLNYNPILRSKRSIISTIHVGDEAWISTPCVIDVGFIPTKNIVLIDGVFYFVSHAGILATFNPADRVFILLKVPPPFRNHFHFHYCTNMVYSDEELLLVCGVSNNVYMLDFAKMCWIEVNNLRGKTLFLGTTSFLVWPPEQTRKLGDRMYQSEATSSAYDKFQFFSFKSRRSFSGLTSYGDVTRIIPESIHICQNLWIEPPPFV